MNPSLLVVIDKNVHAFIINGTSIREALAAQQWGAFIIHTVTLCGWTWEAILRYQRRALNQLKSRKAPRGCGVYSDMLKEPPPFCGWTPCFLPLGTGGSPKRWPLQAVSWNCCSTVFAVKLFIRFDLYDFSIFDGCVGVWYSSSDIKFFFSFLDECELGCCQGIISAEISHW